MGEEYRLKVAREKAEAEGRKKERAEILDFLARLTVAIGVESAEAVLSGQLSEEQREVVLVGASAIEDAAKRIAERGR